MPEDKGENDRDFAGDQIGYAVRNLLPLTPELKALDRKLMRALPRPIARAVALIRFHHGWLPETGDPAGLYNEITDGLGKLYLDKYGEKIRANTLFMPGFGGDLRVHANTFTDGDKELPLRWDKQIEWADTILGRFPGESVDLENLKEATLISQLHTSLLDTLELSKPYFIKRGLPIPIVPKMSHIQQVIHQ